jgi:GGDEF domain-containing protein
LKEFGRRAKACRGSDFAVRLSNDDFLLVLPECNLGEVKLVLKPGWRRGSECFRTKSLSSVHDGWVDYQAGDLPGDLLKRAAAPPPYVRAAKESFCATLHPH